MNSNFQLFVTRLKFHYSAEIDSKSDTEYPLTLWERTTTDPKTWLRSPLPPPLPPNSPALDAMSPPLSPSSAPGSPITDADLYSKDFAIPLNHAVFRPNHDINTCDRDTLSYYEQAKKEHEKRETRATPPTPDSPSKGYPSEVLLPNGVRFRYSTDTQRLQFIDSEYPPVPKWALREIDNDLQYRVDQYQDNRMQETLEKLWSEVIEKWFDENNREEKNKLEVADKVPRDAERWTNFERLVRLQKDAQVCF